MNFAQMINLMEGWASSSIHYENREIIERMLSDGISVEEIASELGMSIEEIEAIIEEMGWDESIDWKSLGKSYRQGSGKGTGWGERIGKGLGATANLTGKVADLTARGIGHVAGGAIGGGRDLYRQYKTKKATKEKDLQRKIDILKRQRGSS